MGRSGLRGSVRSGNTATENFHLTFIKLCSVCLILASNRPKQQPVLAKKQQLTSGNQEVPAQCNRALARLACEGNIMF